MIKNMNMKWVTVVGLLVVLGGLVVWGIFGPKGKGSDKVGGNNQVQQQDSGRGNPIVDQQVTGAKKPAEAPKVAVPVRVSIPKIQIDTVVEQVGLDNVGRMDVPKDFKNVGWYNLGFRPGEKGGAVFAGHLDTVGGRAAVFYNLDKLAIGDEIKVTGEDGKVLTFVVSEKQKYKSNQFPMDKVFNITGSEMLALITCTGTFDRSVRNYTERLVVYSKLKTT